MSSLSPSSPGQPSTASGPPVRHGSCRLCLVINEHVYNLRRSGRKAWQLRKLSGERAGALYQVQRVGSACICTCPDARINNAFCKHQQAILAAGLLPRPRHLARHLARKLATAAATVVLLAAFTLPFFALGPLGGLGTVAVSVGFACIKGVSLV